MSDYPIFTDRNRHAYLQYRDAGKTRHFVCMLEGSIDCIQLQGKDFYRLTPYTKYDAQHFAKIYLSSTLPISRSARAILRGILGQSEDLEGAAEGSKFSSGSVSLEEIAELNNWDPSKCRKHLRKLVEKPGGRWAWPPEEAEKIVGILKECLNNG